MEWFEFTAEDLLEEVNQKEVFQHMLRVLENDGHCRRVYHILAEVLFNDNLGES